MKNMHHFGIICPADIAMRRFLPALQKVSDIDFIGVGVHSNRDKAFEITQKYGGKIFDDYESIVSNSDIDSIYIPLPPALHFEWAKKALLCGKHILLEKPAVLSKKQAEELIELANDRHLAVHENYMFLFHKQIAEIQKLLASKTIGDIRLITLCFGFPRRAQNDFRYNKELGGGALFDAGGYVIKMASLLLGDSAQIVQAFLKNEEDVGVDLYGSGTMINDEGAIVQFSFGMDNDYRCSLEAWGSKGSVKTGRVFTAPDQYIPSYVIIRNGTSETYTLPADDAFKNSIDFFLTCIQDEDARKQNYKTIIKQAFYVDRFRSLASKGSV